MKNADTAMYHAKASGRNNFQFFAPRMNEEATRFFHLEHELRRALEGGELLLHYQPQVDIDAPFGVRAGGPAALAASRAGHGVAGRVHPGCRGDRA